MKEEKLFEAMAEIDEQYVVEANARRKTPQWAKWVAMAACLCVVWALARGQMAGQVNRPEHETEAPETQTIAPGQTPDTQENDAEFASKCDGKDDLRRTVFWFEGEEYHAATIAELEARGLLDERGDFTIPPEKNRGEALGMSENSYAEEMNGLTIYAVASGAGDGDLCVAELPGSVYEYYSKTEEN